MIFEQTRACRIGFFCLIGVCFLTGFVTQLLFSFKGHHHISVIHVKNAETRNHGIRQTLRKGLDESEEMVDVGNTAEVNSTLLSDVIKSDHIPEMSSIGASSSLFLSAVSDTAVPAIVKSWRAAKLDWHELLPRHNSIWERFGNPEKGQGLRLLISKEMQVTDFLTQFHESGLSVKYGHDHGALAEYSGCNSFLSTCMVHGSDKCSNDQLCSWSTAKQLCVDRGDKDADPDNAPQKSCSSPMMIQPGGGLRLADPSECLFYVDQPAVFVRFDSESQAMFYHWWASWSGVVKFWESALESSRDIHIFMEEIGDPTFFDYFGFISNNCWRRATQSFVQVPKGACFCRTLNLAAHQSSDQPAESAKQMITFLDLMRVEPPPSRVKIGIISRRVKRFILNEYELVAAVERMGYECVLLPLEKMTLYEQMKELRSLDVLIGIHGSALDNSVFLHPGKT